MNVIQEPAWNKLLPASLAGKISMGFSIIGLLLVVNLISAYQDAIRTNQGLTHMVDEALPIFTATTEISRQVQQMEPIVLTLLDTESSSQASAQSTRLSELSASIRAGIAQLSPDAFSGELAGRVSTSLQRMAALFNNVDNAMDTLQQNQAALIATRQQIADISATLAAQEQALKPILNDIVFEMDDDYLISLMFEFSASANAGQVIIAKIQASTDPEQIAELQLELGSWISDYKSLQLGLPTTAGSDPDLYRELLTQLSQISNIIIDSAQGVYVSESNDYVNGLQSIKAEEIRLVEAQKQALSAFRQQLSAILKQAEALVSVGNEEMSGSATDIQMLLQAQQRMGLLTGAFGIALVLSISLLIIRYFKRSVAQLRDNLTHLEQGHLVVTHQSVRRDEFGKLIRAVHRVTDSLRDIVSGIGEANDAINDGVNQVSTQSANTRNYVEGQKHELDQVATALTQMSATANEVAGHASNTHQKVSEAETLAEDGRRKVGGSRDMIVQVRDEAERTKQVIDSLNEGVQGIESILATIGGIAEQTNLLALNAAIEAARAGEQGRGFAVVADEVRALASRTQDSTQEIRQMTESMLKESAEAVLVMTQSAKLIAQSVDSAQLADDTIAQFDVVMKEVLDLSHLIATASEEQALTVNELNKNVMQVSTLAEQTQESAETSQSTSEQLRALATALKEKVARFRLD